jgi:hypothetical protein
MMHVSSVNPQHRRRFISPYYSCGRLLMRAFGRFYSVQGVGDGAHLFTSRGNCFAIMCFAAGDTMLRRISCARHQLNCRPSTSVPMRAGP